MSQKLISPLLTSPFPTPISLPLFFVYLGALARVVGCTVLFPLDTLKARLQFQRPSSLSVKRVYAGSFPFPSPSRLSSSFTHLIPPSLPISQSLYFFPLFSLPLPLLGAGDACKHIIKEEGILALWKGLPVRLIYVTPSAAVSFTLYEQFKRMFNNMNTVWFVIL